MFLIPANRPKNALLFGLMLLAGSCGSTASDAPADNAASGATIASVESTEANASPDDATAPVERADLSDVENTVLDQILVAIGDQPTVWEGFGLSDIPAIVPLFGDGGAMSSGFVLFHPDPGAAGAAVPVVGVDPTLNLHYVPQLHGVPTPPVNSFESDAMVGGVETYVFPSDPELEPWPNVYVHEAFHVFQIRSWAEIDPIDQEAYALVANNYQLAMLEDQALIAAYQADNELDMEEAVRTFLALRETRLTDFPHVPLDGQQENLEGTAEWFEWQYTGRSALTDPWSNPFTADLGDPAAFTAATAADFAGVAPLQRFYQSGATQIALLDRLDTDWQAKIEAGAAPAELLAELIPVDPADVDSLVGAAYQTYDPDGAFAELAEAWVSAEFGEDVGAGARGAFSEAPELIQSCLADFGLTGAQVDEDPALLTAEINETCVVAYEELVFACMEEAGVDLTKPFELDDLPAEAQACYD